MMQILKRFANALTMPVSIKTNNYFDELDANFTGTNYSEYFKISKKHALTGDCNAQNNVGFCYENGLGVKQDYYEAVKWYRLAAAQGNVDARKFLDNINYRKLGFETISFTERDSGVGSAYEDVNLGILHDYAKDIAENYTQAFNMMEEAAELGDAFAQLTLGVMYHFGKGVKQDAEKSFKLYTSAANAGLAEAQNNLGFMYDTGNGVEQNYIIAYKWYNVAAANGYKPAQHSRDEIAKLLTTVKITEAQILSKKCPLIKS